MSKAAEREMRRQQETYARKLLVDKLVSLRADLASARSEHRGAVALARATCRSNRYALRGHLKAERARMLAELRANLALQKAAAKSDCAARRAAAREMAIGAVARKRVDVAEYRAYLSKLRRLKRNYAADKRVTARERASESDDDVRQNIEPHLHGLFERVKRSIKGSPRKTRSEAFLEYVEAHPHEYLDAIDDKTRALVRELEQREKRLAKTSRKRRFTAAELAEVPF